MSRHRRHLLLIGCVTLGSILAAACAKGDGQKVQTVPGDGQSASSEAPPGTPADVVIPTHPLRGTAADSIAQTERPAVVVKVDNDPNARPQSGLTHADVVYEIEVEGITRFAAVFHSEDVDQVGPIRSARSSDIDLISALNTPLYAWSGANWVVTSEVDSARERGLLVSIGHDALPDEYWRDNARYAPYNLYSATAGLRAAAPEGAGNPEPIFGYRAPDEQLPDSSFGASGVSIAYEGDGRITGVEFAWDPDLGGWARFQDDQLHDEGSLAHVVDTGDQIAPENVVILMVDYGINPATSSPQAISIGTGSAIVLTGNSRAIEGTWSRDEATDHIRLRTAGGEPIRLTPGRTWVLLPRPGHVNYLTPERAEHLRTAN
jgi:hypothetical protein